MKVITVATHIERYYDSLLDSAKKNDIDLVVLGMGEKWQGYGWKFNKMIEYLKTINPNEIILFIDAYDVIFIDNISKIEKKFLEIKSKNDFKILIGSDILPNNIFYKYLHKRVFSSNNPRNINSGVYMGYAKDILEILTIINENNDFNKTNDQILFIKENNKNPSIFYFDEKHEIIVNAVGDLFNGKTNLENNNFEFITDEDNKIKLVNNDYNTYPMILHGPFNANLDDIILKYNCILTKKNNDSRLKYLLVSIKDYYKFFSMEIYILTIFIYLLLIYFFL
jgi:hypothetical protein